MTTTEEGTLEIDHDRGVIYFHNKQGMTRLRICRLPKPIPAKRDLLDITHMHGTSWTPSGSVECPHCHWGFHPSVIDQHIREKH